MPGRSFPYFFFLLFSTQLFLRWPAFIGRWGRFLFHWWQQMSYLCLSRLSFWNPQFFGIFHLWIFSRSWPSCLGQMHWRRKIENLLRFSRITGKRYRLICNNSPGFWAYQDSSIRGRGLILWLVWCYWLIYGPCAWSQPCANLLVYPRIWWCRQLRRRYLPVDLPNQGGAWCRVQSLPHWLATICRYFLEWLWIFTGNLVIIFWLARIPRW